MEPKCLWIAWIGDQGHDLLIFGHVSGLLIREDPLSVYRNIQHAGRAPAHFWFDPKLALDQLFQAPGPGAVLGSYQAAFNLDIHVVVAFFPPLARMPKILFTIHSGATKT